MKLGRLLIAFVCLAALAAVVRYAGKEKTEEVKPPKDAPPKILSLTEDSIRQIEIKHRTGDPTVVKKNDAGKWEITAPKPLAADQSAVSGVASAVTTLTSERLIDDKVTDLASY